MLYLKQILKLSQNLKDVAVEDVGQALVVAAVVEPLVGLVAVPVVVLVVLVAVSVVLFTNVFAVEVDAKKEVRKVEVGVDHVVVENVVVQKRNTSFIII